ncbi:unnamed protein product, partial [Symbiodinium pilosum]
MRRDRVKNGDEPGSSGSNTSSDVEMQRQSIDFQVLARVGIMLGDRTALDATQFRDFVERDPDSFEVAIKLFRMQMVMAQAQDERESTPPGASDCDPADRM